MNGSLKLTLDVAQLVMLGGLVWGLATMSAALKENRQAIVSLTEAFRVLGEKFDLLVMSFAKIVTRVTVLEDRQRRE